MCQALIYTNGMVITFEYTWQLCASNDEKSIREGHGSVTVQHITGINRRVEAIKVGYLIGS